MTPKQEAALRLAREALKLNCSSQTESPATKALAAIDEVLAEQPAQQDYWQEEARRYAQNAEFWRGKYEAETAQQQKPDGRVISANWEYATVQWLHQTSNIGGGDPKNSRSWPIGGEDVYLSPQPSKPWVGLEESEWREIDDRHDWTTTQGRIDAAEEIEAKLKEKNA